MVVASGIVLPILSQGSLAGLDKVIKTERILPHRQLPDQILMAALLKASENGGESDFSAHKPGGFQKFKQRICHIFFLILRHHAKVQRQGLTGLGTEQLFPVIPGPVTPSARRIFDQKFLIVIPANLLCQVLKTFFILLLPQKSRELCHGHEILIVEGCLHIGGCLGARLRIAPVSETVDDKTVLCDLRPQIIHVGAIRPVVVSNHGKIAVILVKPLCSQNQKTAPGDQIPEIAQGRVSDKFPVRWRNGR